MTKKQSATGRKSRRKGKCFERQVAAIFTKATGVKWETTRNSGRTDLKGDIYCPEKPDLLVIVECKHRKKLSMTSLVKYNKSVKDVIDETRSKMMVSYHTLQCIVVFKTDFGIWLTVINKRIDDKVYPVFMVVRHDDLYKPSIRSGSYTWIQLDGTEKFYLVQGRNKLVKTRKKSKKRRQGI